MSWILPSRNLLDLSRNISFRDTKANIIADLASIEEVRFAFATDTSEIGIFTNGVWAWIGGGGTGTIIREAIFTKPGDLYVGVGVTRYYNLTGGNLTISLVHLAVHNVPLGIAIIADVNIDGVTIFTNQANRPRIEAGANTGQSSAMDTVIWPNGSYVTMDLDQVGSTFPGANFTGTIVC